MRACLQYQFAVHLVETLDCFRYASGHFEMIAESAINRESRGSKLQTNGMSTQRAAPERKDILTFRAATKASLHESLVNFDFAHSLMSGVGDGERMAASTLLSGVERHRCMKSVAKYRMRNGGRGNMTRQKPSQ
jgi:hypothetical protein